RRDMGFWPDVRRIVAALPPPSAGRQTLLFSATMPNEVVRDALEITRDAKYVQVGQRSAPARSITHRIESVSAGHKAEWLIDYLRRAEGPVLIFTRTKIRADKLARKLASAGACPPTAARNNVVLPSKASRAESTRCWSRPTSRRAASTSTRFTR